MNALREIAQALSSTVELDSTLDLIVRKTTEVMRVDSCTLYLLDPDGPLLRLRATTGLANRALGRATLRVGEGMTGEAVARNRPMAAAEARDNPHFKTVEEAEEGRFTSLLAVPLEIEGRPIGALNVQTLAAHTYTAEEISLLSLIGDLAAGAISKASLYDAQRRQLEELQVLARVSEAVTSPQYLDDILNVVTEVAAQSIGAAVCSIFLLDEGGESVKLRSAKKAAVSYEDRPPLRLGQGVVGQVVDKGEQLYVADVRTDERYLDKAWARDQGLVSLLCTPLRVRERVIGALTCYTAAPHKFTRKQRTFFTTLANQTALAIENAQLVTNAAVVREMHHRIKNNLQTVAMLMQLQMAEADKLNTREVLQISIDRIKSIATVHEVLSEKGYRLVDVKDVLTRIMREVMVRPQQNIQIDVFGEALTLPSRAATALALVVNELVQNSVEHGFAGRADGRVEISLGRSAKQLIVVVRDNGRGFAPGYAPGLGLEIATTLVKDDLQGQIKFNRPSQGVEVSIRMPRSLENGLE